MSVAACRSAEIPPSSTLQSAQTHKPSSIWPPSKRMVPIRLGVSEEFLIWGELSPHNVSEFHHPNLLHPSTQPCSIHHWAQPRSPSKLHKELPLALRANMGRRSFATLPWGQPTQWRTTKNLTEIDGKGFLLPMKGHFLLFFLTPSSPVAVVGTHFYHLLQRAKMSLGWAAQRSASDFALIHCFPTRPDNVICTTGKYNISLSPGKEILDPKIWLSNSPVKQKHSEEVVGPTVATACTKPGLQIIVFKNQDYDNQFPSYQRHFQCFISDLKFLL